ncbi:hemerythrin domain-containing protein [uncultured Thiodictyon sp.]|jgi:hemerythrin-like domain-containing protein|uniref:hemerythrin domain-containing protein n=1 Tax=uncultured Thiodictyon sp. TaxID=1846217 RepID=UPI0025ECC1BC|nr:hemerythrin domain-containing protein [uncultured Thiodictyon sp.]
MHTLDGYRSTHSDLRQMLDDLRSLLTTEQLRIRPNAKTAYELLCDLGERVRRHLAEEDRSLYPSLLIHEDPKVKSIAWGFISGEKPLRQTFNDYHTHWLKNCDFNFSDDFLTETRAVFDLVAQRIDREEQVLLPKLLEIGMFQDARAPLGARHGADHAPRRW